jgi:hypothetical protein
MEFEFHSSSRSGASMRLACALAAGLIAASSVPGFAYTAADAKACMPDAFRLCAKAIPNESKVAACLQAKQKQLSANCLEALDRFTGVQNARRTAQPSVYKD